jgi:hypothetical protein
MTPRCLVECIDVPEDPTTFIIMVDISRTCSTRLHGVMYQKTEIFIVTAVRTSNLALSLMATSHRIFEKIPEFEKAYLLNVTKYSY